VERFLKGGGVYRPTTRVLAVLELLQSRKMSGRELARRLEVDGRTVRRYVTTLQDMGIPVEGERGRYGAYSLRPGYKMPPLMFTDEEALGLGLGLLAARQLGLSGVAPAVEGALAKVERVMPEALRGRLRALEHAIVPAAAPVAGLAGGETVSGLAGAVDGRRRVRLRYRTDRRGETERVVEPYAVLRQEGRWYLFGYCRLREGTRLFRLDRVLGTEVLDERFDRPMGLEAPEAVLGAVAGSHAPWEVEVLLKTSLEHAREQVSPMLASLREVEGGVVMSCTVPELWGMARVLSGLFCPFVVKRPPELGDALERHAKGLIILARDAGDETPQEQRGAAGD
jgi:predicted DNA-binding transcriptional regulator YafY